MDLYRTNQYDSDEAARAKLDGNLSAIDREIRKLRSEVYGRSGSIAPIEEYDGPTVFVPCDVIQTAGTEGKYLSGDMQFQAIPYHESDNIYGTTVTIGS